MWEDPIVKEVREARLEIEKECDNDFRKIYERALEIQNKLAENRVFTDTVKAEKEEELLSV